MEVERPTALRPSATRSGTERLTSVLLTAFVLDDSKMSRCSHVESRRCSQNEHVVDAADENEERNELPEIGKESQFPQRTKLRRRGLTMAPIQCSTPRSSKRSSS